MPDAMPRPIAKGKLLNALDAFVNQPPNSAALQVELGNQAQTVLQAAANAGFVFPAGSQAHLHNHWFGANDSGGTWWQELQPVANIVRCGLLDALGRVAPGVPIYIYWICGPDTFEVVSAVTPQQLTLLILTPVPPTRGPLITYDQANLEEIYETTADLSVAEIPGPQPGAGKGVITLRQKQEA